MLSDKADFANLQDIYGELCGDESLFSIVVKLIDISLGWIVSTSPKRCASTSIHRQFGSHPLKFGKPLASHC